jgi:hypothetical protein
MFAHLNIKCSKNNIGEIMQRREITCGRLGNEMFEFSTASKI